MKRLTPYAILAFVLALPLHAHAQVALTNPLGTTDVNVLIGRIIMAFLSISGAIALIMFLYGGILWLTSAGNPEMVQKGRRTLIWAVLGIVVITSAYVITNSVFNALLTGDVAG